MDRQASVSASFRYLRMSDKKVKREVMSKRMLSVFCPVGSKLSTAFFIGRRKHEVSTGFVSVQQMNIEPTVKFIIDV